jgi:hypothetical protein
LQNEGFQESSLRFRDEHAADQRIPPHRLTKEHNTERDHVQHKHTAKGTHPQKGDDHGARAQFFFQLRGTCPVPFHAQKSDAGRLTGGCRKQWGTFRD